ncbi:hypothetical protein A1O1_03452 [Capronia coronata CBS 617.96]|uniref:t-SNARE coiled-coil homology domain-containing protein n=1 Tax=Capronia coronata CBS 617.96 TaxID=1182541 RepID=W9YCZ4_9EURO|nr:uncharacterized protein A1O1_03452 [Capronia coronata CBS 617.96]EXJ90353.1 hypothetical protein A1O1_03452 [Capronia coronata CBS 617.96]
MTDQSGTLSLILVEKHSSRPIRGRRRDLGNKLDAFLREAYEINRSISSLLTYLRSLRSPYLSNAPPPRHPKRPDAAAHAVTGAAVTSQDVPEYLTDSQREAIDHETSSVLREINTKITNLSSAVNLQHDTAMKLLEKKYGRPDGFLWRWAAGDGDAPDAGKSSKQIEEEGRIRTLKSVRDGVLWYLSKRLNDAIMVQQEMVEKRLERERQKQMSALHDPRNKGVRAAGEPEFNTDGPETLPNRDLRGHDEYRPWNDTPRKDQTQQLSAEQLQLFEEENRSIFEHFNDQLAKVTQVEKSLMEISSLQQTLVGHLSVQGEMIGSLVTDAANTDENVRKGNRELKRASERGSTARLVFYATVGFCSFLVVWDLIF